MEKNIISQSNKTQSNKKAQAALEFLMTYGWAFLLILVMIGAFVYFGVFNPSRSLPDKCLLGNSISCTDFQIDSAASPFGTIKFTIKQNLGQTLFIQNVNVTSQDFGNNQPCAVDGTLLTGANEVQMDNVAQLLISCPLSGGSLTMLSFKGDKTTVNLRVDYRQQRSTFTHTEIGELYGTVQ